MQQICNRMENFRNGTDVTDISKQQMRARENIMMHIWYMSRAHVYKFQNTGDIVDTIQSRKECGIIK